MQQMRTPSPLQSWLNGDSVEVEEDLIFLEPADIGELCSLMPKIPSRKFVVLMEKVRAAAASESPGVFRFFLCRRVVTILPRQVLSALAPPSTCLRGPRRQHRCPPLRNQRSLPQTKRLRQSVPRLLPLSWPKLRAPAPPCHPPTLPRL